MKKSLLLSILLTSFLFSGNSAAQTYGWTQRADYGGGETYDPFSFVIGNKGYAGTGRALPGLNKNDFWEYDPAVDAWTQKADFMGTGRYGAKGFSIGNYGYAGTGWDPAQTATFYRYDPVNNIWMAIAGFGGSARYTGTAFSIDNYGFLGLGYSPCKNDFWRYDPQLDAWSQVAVFPGGARQAAVSFVINGVAYAGTGSCQSSLYQDFYKYNSSSNTWSAIAPLPGNGRAGAFAFSIGGNGYVGAGYDYQNNSTPYTIFTDFWEYNAANDVWTQLPDFPGGKLFSSTAYSINNKGYVGMGSDTIFNTHFVQEFWEYGPVSTGIAEDNTTIEIKIHPVPATDLIEINLGNTPIDGRVLLELTDVAGKVFCSKIIETKTSIIKLNITDFKSGMYFCSMVKNGKLLAREKFLKLH